MKTIPKLKAEKPEGVNANSLGGGAIFLYENGLYIKDASECAGTNLLTGHYDEGLENAKVIEVDATLTWQKKKPKAEPKKKKKKKK